MPITIRMFGLVILGVIFVLQMTEKQKEGKTLKSAKILSGAAIVMVIGFLVYYSYMQMAAWRGSGVMKVFFEAEPEKGADYAFGYILVRYWAQYITSFIVGGIFFLGAWQYNRKHSGQFFYKEEPYIIGLSVFLLGHPLWVFYIPAALVFYLGFSIFSHLVYIKKRNRAEEGAPPRTSFYYGWIPAALFTMMLKRFLLEIGILRILTFSIAQVML
jgi:hypothetical protein